MDEAGTYPLPAVFSVSNDTIEDTQSVVIVHLNDGSEFVAQEGTYGDGRACIDKFTETLDRVFEEFDLAFIGRVLPIGGEMNINDLGEI